jgi:hypothetical protein
MPIMGKKIGTGELKPFKDSKTGSETISNATDGAKREGFFDKQMITKASRNVTELEPFKMGPPGPGKNTQAVTVNPSTGNPTVPPFKEGGPKIKTFPAFSDKPCEY